jgi:putative transposase
MGFSRIFPQPSIFHICNKSISNYQIFRSEKSIIRFIITVNYYNNREVVLSLSKALREPLNLPYIMENNSNRIFSLLGYCVMPDHYHLLIKMTSDYSLSKYINALEGSYSHYFNKQNKRKGPLWQSRFRSISIQDNATLLHVHRYIHLNPTTAGLVNKPEDWKWSSYNFFISDQYGLETHKEISINNINTYKKFVEDQLNYQKTIKGIRRSLLE